MPELSYGQWIVVTVIVCAIFLLFVIPRRPRRKLAGTITVAPEDKAELRRIRDCAEINAGRCPDCGSTGSLCEGPSGGMSQNIACDQCHMEFNVGFGFGTGAFMVDRSGRLDESRARQSFGFKDADFPPKKAPRQ